jgi:magnesium chelatase subunit H
MNKDSDAHSLPADERDRRVLELQERLLEIERRLIPTGLHVFGRPTSSEQCADLLRMVASFDRPEHGARALPRLIADGLGLSREISTGGDPAARMSEGSVCARDRVDAVTRESIRRFMESDVSAACRWLEDEARVAADESRPVFELLGRVRAQLQTNREMDSLARALRGEYIEPGPGAPSPNTATTRVRWRSSCGASTTLRRTARAWRRRCGCSACVLCATR